MTLGWDCRRFVMGSWHYISHLSICEGGRGGNRVNAGNVTVQNQLNQTDYFMNTGISLFFTYDMIYNLKDGEIGLLDEPRHRTGKGWKDKRPFRD